MAESEVEMPATVPIPESRIEELEGYGRRRGSGPELKRFLCVWLRVEQGLAATQIAKAVGWNANTVRIVQRDFIALGAESFDDGKRGGRAPRLMAFEEEAEFLKSFVEKAADASMLVANEVKAALEAKLGRGVHKTTVYRMLKRHKWRKVMPRPKHPEQDEEAVGAFKKGAARKQSEKPGRKQKKERCR